MNSITFKGKNCKCELTLKLINNVLSMHYICDRNCAEPDAHGYNYYNKKTIIKTNRSFEEIVKDFFEVRPEFGVNVPKTFRGFKNENS